MKIHCLATSTEISEKKKKDRGIESTLEAFEDQPTFIEEDKVVFYKRKMKKPKESSIQGQTYEISLPPFLNMSERSQISELKESTLGKSSYRDYLTEQKKER